MTLRQIVQALRDTYCGLDRRRVHARHRADREALVQQRLETVRSKPDFTAEQKLHILERPTTAEAWSATCTPYVGQKRFSLEGGESFYRLDGRTRAARRCQGRRRS